MFKEIEPNKRKSAKVAEQILDAIRNGSLNPGDRLPSEHELAQTMNVSRPSVREALSGLQAVGIVKARTGAGTYVNDSLPSVSPGTLTLSMLEEEPGYLDIIEARKNLEQAVLEIVIDKAEQSDLSNLNEVLQLMDAHSTDQDYQEYMDADHDFHKTLAITSKNPLVIEALKPLIATINGELYRELTHKYYLVDDSRIKRCFRIHQNIFQAIKEGDLEQARNGMRRHWTLMEEALEVAE